MVETMVMRYLQMITLFEYQCKYCKLCLDTNYTHLCIDHLRTTLSQEVFSFMKEEHTFFVVVDFEIPLNPWSLGVKLATS